jgi:hypothetical protein
MLKYLLHNLEFFFFKFVELFIFTVFLRNLIFLQLLGEAAWLR